MSDTCAYSRPALTVDCVVFGFGSEGLKVLLVKRLKEPFAGRWALPGGFVEEGEDLLEAARRELEEETSLFGVSLEQFAAFGRPGRDPRGWTVSVAYLAVVRCSDHRAKAASDAGEAAWFPARDLPPLAFDHAEIVDQTSRRLKEKLGAGPTGLEFLPPDLTAAELQELRAEILGRP